jgi:hypothetical protein
VYTLDEVSQSVFPGICVTTVEYDDINDEGIEIKFDKESVEVDESEDGGDEYHQFEARYPRAEPTYCGTHRSKYNEDESG